MIRTRQMKAGNINRRGYRACAIPPPAACRSDVLRGVFGPELPETGRRHTYILGEDPGVIRGV